MGRILKAYETQFAWLLQQAGARRPQEGVQRMVQQARQKAVSNDSLTHALTQTYERLSSHPFYQAKKPILLAESFYCDAGLGGLARWLRAAGYRAEWVSGIDDSHLLGETRRLCAVLLTTDSMLMERRLIRLRIIPAFWLPPTLSIQRQLEIVLKEFRLKPRTPLCMNCGGKLLPGHKESLRDRIPPRTYQWLDEYFTCEQCGQLFWHGTHWHRIRSALADKTS